MLLVSIAALAAVFLSRQTPVAPIYTATTEDGSASLAANWKTYRNDKYGFEMKYPPNFEIETSPISKMTGLGICIEERCEKFLAIDEKLLPLADPKYQNYRKLEAPRGSSSTFYYYAIKTTATIADQILSTFKFMQ